LDGTGSPVRDVLLETWQANASGIYAHNEDPRHSEVEQGFSAGDVLFPISTAVNS